MKSSYTVEQGKKNFAKQIEGLLNVPAEEFSVGSYVSSMQLAKKEGLSGIMGMMPWTKNSPELKARDEELTMWALLTPEELAAKTTRPFNRRRKDELAQLSGKTPEYITENLKKFDMTK
jgi:hypothetical protein